MEGAKFIASLLFPILDPIVHNLPLIFPDKEQIDYLDVQSQIRSWKP